jgi:hypothetical protein
LKFTMINELLLSELLLMTVNKLAN